jgi:hypothetical protein
LLTTQPNAAYAVAMALVNHFTDRASQTDQIQS